MDQNSCEKQSMANHLSRASSLPVLAFLIAAMLFTGGCAGKSAAMETTLATEAPTTASTESTAAETRLRPLRQHRRLLRHPRLLHADTGSDGGFHLCPSRSGYPPCGRDDRQ